MLDVIPGQRILTQYFYSLVTKTQERKCDVRLALIIT